jgi:hypothetical protein
MFSPLDQRAVMAGLGDKFLRDLASSVSGARADLAAFRQWRPGWFPPMSERCLANLIHDRIWAHLVAAVNGNPNIDTIDNEPIREIWLDAQYRMRVKRHHADDTISTYPTAAALEFWTQGSPLPGLETITLGVGYRWIADVRGIGPPVVSYRDGMDNPIWVVELDEPEDGSVPIRWMPVTRPDLPVVDLYDAARENRSDEDGVSS